MQRLEVASVTAALHKAGFSATKRVRRVQQPGYHARQYNAFCVTVFFDAYHERWMEMEASAERSLTDAGFIVSRPFQKLFVVKAR